MKKKQTLLHRQTLDLDDLVQMDLSLLGEAVEEYVFKYCTEHNLDNDEIDYEWSHPVEIRIYRRR